MAAIDTLTPTAAAVVRLFAVPFRSAPTADIIVWGVNQIESGSSPSALLDLLFNLQVPNSPFTAYSSISTIAAFTTALVDNLSVGTNVDVAVKASWGATIQAAAPAYATRGALTWAVIQYIEGYSGSNSDLLTLKANVADHVEQAAAFAQSPAGAVWDRMGFAQLLAPLEQPTYALSTDRSTVDEGKSVVFMLQTSNVAPGTTFPYILSGTGIDNGDLVFDVLTGSFTVDTNGRATTRIPLLADGVAEGSETLRLTLGDNLAHAEVTVLEPIASPPPTYTLTANVSAVEEAGTVTYTLTTTHVGPGTAIPYALSGTGITAADIVGGALTGSITVNAAGSGVFNVTFAADGATEAPEVLRLTLGANLAQIETTILDSNTPPTSGPDTRVIYDNMGHPGAGVPPTPEAGEIRINTYLTYDLLDQSGSGAVRMNVAALKASHPVAGTTPDPTNFKADRGNLPQLSNQSLFVFDLLGGIDRVDYSAETGRIVAPISAEAPIGTQYILVNDNGTDNAFNSATDRMDELRNVEQIVASAGGGVLDLTASGQSWKITFSRSFSPTGDVTASLDRATHRVELDPTTSGAATRTFYEFRDAGFNGSITQAAALWSVVQGSDLAETLIFSHYQVGEARTNELRGGNNRVEYSDASTKSIITNVGLTPWVASVSPAATGNASGVVTAAVTFTNGDGATLLSPNAVVTSSHTPDNKVAAGKLIISATDDVKDTVTFDATPQSKWIELGLLAEGRAAASLRLTSVTGGAAAEFQHFEVLRDNGASDDVYDVKNIARATSSSLRLTDGAGADHDMVRLAAEALGSTAVGGNNSFINLATLNAGFNFDFDVLDVSRITGTSLSLVGTPDADDELVVGAIREVAVATGFESLVLTNASMELGSSFELDLDSITVRVGELRNFFFTGSALSAGGLALGTQGQTNPIQPVASAMNMTITDRRAAGGTLVGGSGNDTLSGGAGNDTLRGGGGNDTIDTGLFAETWALNPFGTLDAVASTTNRIRIVMSIDGTELTLTEAAIADTSYGDRNGAVVDGSGRVTIGTAMAALINANLAAINAGPGTGRLESAALNFRTLDLELRFDLGVDVNDVVTIALDKGGDAGTFGLTALVNTNGGGGGNDRIVFEATAAANGHDSIVNFRANSDKLDFSAFAGGAITAGPAINAATGGTFAGVATRAEFVFNKAGGLLSGSDFATATGAGKFVIADGARCVVAVTADPTGARGDLANTPFSLYYVTNGAAAGLSDLEVTLVGTVSGVSELTLANIAAAMT